MIEKNSRKEQDSCCVSKPRKMEKPVPVLTKCKCGQSKCEEIRIPVNTDNGEVFILSKNPARDLQSKIDHAAKIEIDGLGKVVKYEHAEADKAENSYKIITGLKKKSFWARLKSFFS